MIIDYYIITGQKLLRYITIRNADTEKIDANIYIYTNIEI